MDQLISTLHILLIEDDPDDVELLETAFIESGVKARFSVIAQGDKALSFLKQSAALPDIVLLDLNLPKVHGKEVLTGIKAREEHQDLPVVILTTSSAQSDIDFCLTAGAQYYFTKPTRLADFQDIVKAVLKATGRK